MSGKQAKVLTDKQIKAVLGALEGSRNGLRNKVMFLLSLHGLRSKEVASIEISMVTDSSGAINDHITLEDKASKGKSGRVVYISNELRETLTRSVLLDRHVYIESECLASKSIGLQYPREE
jgi:integrase